MFLKGDPNRYGVIAAMLHWLSAAAILAMIPLGFIAAHAPDAAQATALLRIHLPLGLVILALTVARIIWWLVDIRPAPPSGQTDWQHRLAGGSHVLLYVLILLLCGSGIGVVILSGAGPEIFSGRTGKLPDFMTFPPMRVHAAGAFALIGLLILHFIAALYHQFWRRDRLFARMRVGSSGGPS
ncbi:MAG: cytochrome B [Azospirillum brasilense]|mgnify:CR=1 FL=1|nr:MAG: cytochrome B [Azospirillum brasilense]